MLLTGILIEYDFFKHVASDIAIDHKFLPTESFETQDHIDYIANWANEILLIWGRELIQTRRIWEESCFQILNTGWGKLFLIQ